MVQQYTVAGGAAATHPAAQLVQLGQAEAFRILDDHQAGVGHIHTHLDHGGGDQQMQVASLEGGHDLGLLRRFHAAVDQSDGQARQSLAKRLPGGFGGLRLQLL